MNVDFKSLGPEGYVIRTVGERLVIAGGQLRGNMYGVYGFLEDHLGCRWFAPGVSRIPKSPRLAVGPIDDRQVPALEYREPYVARLFRRRLVRAEPHELEHRPAGGEARRQDEDRHACPHVPVARAAGEVFQAAPGVFLAGRRPAAWTDMRSFAAPTRT